MNFLELKIAFKKLGYELFKARDFRGVGYFIDNGLDTRYIGSNIRDINIAYHKIKEGKIW